MRTFITLLSSMILPLFALFVPGPQGKSVKAEQIAHEHHQMRNYGYW